MPTLATRLKQTKPFSSPEHEAFLAIQRLASELVQGSAELLKAHGLTGAQYNVLRILRGAGRDGLACSGIGDRLVARDPDMTRLLDRMEKSGFVERARASDDRRVVTTRITAKGLAVVAKIDAPMAELHKRQLGHLGRARLKELLSLLEDALNAGSSLRSGDS
jgi:DNA-binding MarR family transcriptional regulator